MTDNKGWVCPKCGAVLAPWKDSCPCSPPTQYYIPYPYIVPQPLYPQWPWYGPYVWGTDGNTASGDYTITIGDGDLSSSSTITLDELEDYSIHM